MSRLRVLSTWPNVSRKSSISVSSDIFGINGQFIPEQYYDFGTLEAIVDDNDISPSSTTVSLVNTNNHSTTPFDVVLLSLSSLRQLNKIHKSLNKLIISGHTVILLDTSRSPPIQNFVRSKFLNNQVCCVSLESNVYKLPGNGQKYYHVSSSTGSSNKVFFEPPSQDSYELRASSLVRDLILYLQTSGLDSSQSQSQAHYLLLQWKRAIPLIAFEPLSIMLDISDSNKLIQSVVARPIYEGLINELLLMAKAQLEKLSPDCSKQLGTINDFINPYLIQSVNSKVLSPPFPHSTSIQMYYDFFHQFPLPVDVIVLHPILLSDELGLSSSTPYLECIFAFMSQLVKLNDEDNNSLFHRRDSSPNTSLVAPTIGSSSPASSNTGSSNSLLTTTVIDAKSSITALKIREEALTKREQAILAREQALSYQEVPQPQMLRKQSMSYPGRPPSRQQNVQYNQLQLNRPKVSPKRNTEPIISYSANANTNIAPALPPPSTPTDIDMMNITARRSRRSMGATHNSDLSLNRMSSSAGYHRMSSPALSTLASAAPQTFSQQFDLNDAVSGSDRYGMVANKPIRRLSSAIFRTGGSKSRSNSITSQAAANFAFTQGQRNTGQQIETNGYALPNGHAQPNGYTQSQTQPNGHASHNPYANGVISSNGMTNGTANGSLHVDGK